MIGKTIHDQFLAALAPWRFVFSRTFLATDQLASPGLAHRKVVVEIRELGRLAGPLVLGFVGGNLLGLVDTAMVGRLGANELAGVAIGNGLFFTVSIAAMGVVFGMDPVVSQAVGAGEGARAHAAFRAGMRLALLIGLPATLVLGVLPFALPFFGIDAAVATTASHFLWARAPGAIPFIVLMAIRSYLQANGSVAPMAWAMVVANVVNVIANALLIFGDATLVRIGLPAVGLPALGVAGSGLASTIATFAQLAVVARGYFVLPDPVGGGDTAVPLRMLVRLGFPIGLTLLAEVGAFTLVGLFAARIGATAAAGHQIAIMLASFTFTVAMGIANATSVRVGHAVGRGDTPGARRAGFVGLAMAMTYMAASALAFLVFANGLASLLSDRDEVLHAAIPLLYIAAAFQIFDGAQVVGAGALRGLGETRFVQHANVIGYYVIGLPIALGLAFGLGWAERGLWWGLCAGLAFVAVTLGWRFNVLSARPVARV